jgi:hypothetical protein
MRLQFGNGKQSEAEQAQQNRERLSDTNIVAPQTQAEVKVEVETEARQKKQKARQKKQQETRPNVTHTAPAPSPVASMGRVFSVVLGLIIIGSLALKPLTGSNVFEWLKEVDLSQAYGPDGIAKSKAVAQLNIGNLPGAVAATKTMSPSPVRTALLQDIIGKSRVAANPEATLQAAVVLEGPQEILEGVGMIYIKHGLEKTLAFVQQGDTFSPSEKETILPALVSFFPTSELDNTLKMIETITDQKKKEMGYLNMIPLYLYQGQRQKAEEMSKKITDNQIRISSLQARLNNNIAPPSVRMDATSTFKKVKVPLVEAEAILEEMRQMAQSNNADQASTLNSYTGAITLAHQNYLNDKDFLSARKIALLHPDKKMVLNHLQVILMQMTIFQESTPIGNATQADVLSLVKEMSNVAMQMNNQQIYNQFDGQLGSAIDYYIRKGDNKFAQELMGFFFNPLSRQQHIESMQRGQNIIRY